MKTVYPPTNTVCGGIKKNKKNNNNKKLDMNMTAAFIKPSLTKYTTTILFSREARWPSGRVSDSGARGRGFDPHSCRRVVSLVKIHLPPKKFFCFVCYA